MQDIMNILLEDNITILIFFTTILASMIFTLLSKRVDHFTRIRELELKNAIIENMSNESEDTVKEAITRIPEGVNEDEFFDRLKKNCLKLVIFNYKMIIN